MSREDGQEAIAPVVSGTDVQRWYFDFYTNQHVRNHELSSTTNERTQKDSPTLSMLEKSTSSQPQPPPSSAAAGATAWFEDSWNEDDLKYAQQIVQQHWEQCRLISNTSGGAGSLYEVFVAPSPSANEGTTAGSDNSGKETKEEAKNRDNGESEENENDDGYYWDQFYHDHGTRFFKDRHYLHKAFPIEFGSDDDQQNTKDGSGGGGSISSTKTKNKTLVELGCGVGNAILPMLEHALSQEEQTPPSEEWTTIHALDISPKAIDLLREEERFIQFNERGKRQLQRQNKEDGVPYCQVHGHVCDLSKSLPKQCHNVANVTTLLFCLSAIQPGIPMETACYNICQTLQPGGVLVFRDYGRYDLAQLKLASTSHSSTSSRCIVEYGSFFYRKSDGTCCYYFTTEELIELFTSPKCGLKVLDCHYEKRVYRNLKSGETRRRVWIQGRFQKAF